MKFDWDPAKNEINIEKHGFDFRDAEQVFRNKILVRQDTRSDYGETRLIGIGLLGFDTVVVIFVEKNENTIRIISIREATPDESAKFRKNFQN